MTATRGRSAKPGLSRREFLRQAGRGGVGLAAWSLLAACAGTEPAPPGTSASGLPPLAHELAVAQWPLYIDRARGGRRPTLEAFEAETGIDVTYREIISDNQAFFAKLVPQLSAGQPTGWDLIALSDWVVTRMDRAGWLVELDHSLLPTVERNLLPAFRDPDYDPSNAHSTPWQGGVTGIAYYPELAGGAITSFADLWNERLAGHVGMLTEMVDTVTMTMLSLGIDPQAATIDDARRAQERLLEQRDAGIVRAYYGQNYVDAMAARDVWATMAWSGDVFYYKYLGGNPDLEFAVPDEGGVIWTTPVEIPASAAHPRDAHAFMDFFYRPEIAAMVTDWVLYMSPVAGVQEIMREKARDATGDDREYYETLAESPLVFPPEDPAQANLHQYKVLSEEEFQAYNELFSGVINA